MNPFFRLTLSAFAFFIAAFAVPAYAQVASQSVLMVMSKADTSFVKLRWAATSPVMWQKSNKSGFIVEKFVLVRDKKLLNAPVSTKRYEIRLQPLERWEPLVKLKRNERYAAIALQAIYGKNFNVQSAGTNNFNAVMTGVQDLEMRYSFAMMSADYSFDVAQAMGVGFLDKDVKRNEKYLYKIYPATANDSKTDTAYTVVGLEDFRPLPQPFEVSAQFGSHAATISWNTQYHEHIYTGYFIERSEDGVHFEQLSDIPVTRPVKENQPDNNKVIYKTDSLPKNDVVYYYRVVGLTPFGETGPPSKVVSGQGKEAFAAMPIFEKPEIRGNRLFFRWYFLDERDKSLAKIKGFAIEQSVLADGDYHAMQNSLFHPSVRSATDSLKEGTRYYRLKIVDKDDKAFYSFAQMVQAPDSIPPAPPVALIGMADTSGVVSLRWQKVADKDLLGYKVFRSNHRHTEYSLITSSPVPDTVFTDRVQVNTLSEMVYYRVAAVDKNYNHSEYSAEVEVVKPDRVPPAAPVLSRVSRSDDAVKVEWINSSSNDVIQHQLYRKETAQTTWDLVETIPVGDNVSAAIDGTVKAGKNYSYAILAVDRSKLESKPSNVVAISIPKEAVQLTGIKTDLKPDTGELTVLWDHRDNVKHYWIYRSVNNEALTLYKKIGSVNRFADKITHDGKCTYRIKVFFKDDQPSIFSRPIVVE